MIDRSPGSYIGSVIGERYRVESLLGQGGMGVLFVAEHLFTQRKVALKLLHPAREDLPDLRARFISEARTAAATRHPNIVDVLDMGLSDDGSPFLVMELLEGVSLDHLLRDRGKLSAADALECLLPIAGALALLHDAGIVHRDIKPSNIFLATQPSGGVCPKLLDFGLARAISDLRLTRSGIVLGTPMYMAPEQASGEDVSTQSDVWSFGVVLYECITGEPPFTSHDSQAIAVQVLAGRTRPMRSVCPDIPMPLAEAVERCLRGNRELRYQDMRELAACLVAGASASRVRLPEDPDPLGLPDYRRWLATVNQAVTTQELELPRSKAAVAEPAPTTQAASNPGLPMTADAGVVDPDLGAEELLAGRGLGLRAIGLGLLVILGLSLVWFWDGGERAATKSAPTLTPKTAPEVRPAPVEAPPVAPATLKEPAAIPPIEPAPVAPPPPTMIPEKVVIPVDPPSDKRKPAKRPHKTPREPAARPVEVKDLPRTQGGVELEDEWK